MIPEAHMGHVAELYTLRAWIQALADGREPKCGAEVSRALEDAARSVLVDGLAANDRAKPYRQPSAVPHPRVR